jgi:hypothetical protein
MGMPYERMESTCPNPQPGSIRALIPVSKPHLPAYVGIFKM